MPPIRILFLPGIEARSWPRKCELLSTLANVETFCSDLGSADWVQRIWISLVFLGIIYILGLIFTWYGAVKHHIGLGIALLITVVASALLVAIAFGIARFCLRRAYTQAEEVARGDVESFRPDMIVGQSFGAVVALKLQDPAKPLLLLAPARRYFCSWAGVAEPTCNSAPAVMIVHGTKDRMIPIEDARDICREAKVYCCLKEWPLGDHSLSTVTASRLGDFVEELYKMSFPDLPVPSPLYPWSTSDCFEDARSDISGQAEFDSVGSPDPPGIDCDEECGEAKPLMQSGPRAAG